jgi:hypothetical protein
MLSGWNRAYPKEKRLSMKKIFFGVMMISAVIAAIHHYGGFRAGGNKVSGARELSAGNIRDARQADTAPLVARVKDANPVRLEKTNTALYIVRTGVHDQNEFRTHPDTIATRFYRSLGITKIDGYKPGFSGFVYVSYRRGNQCCFWTSRKHLVVPTQVLYTDSGFWIRKRCGNALSDQPMSPVESSDQQPNDDQLGTEKTEVADTLHQPNGPMSAFEIANLLPADFTLPEIPNDGQMASMVRTGAAPGTGEKSMVSTGTGSGWMLPSSGLAFSGPYTPLGSNQIKDPVTSTPEPGQLLCVVGTLSLLAAIRRVGQR